MAGLASVLEEACRDADVDAPGPTSVEANAPSAAADASEAGKQHGMASEKADGQNMDELYEEYRRWKQEQERKKLVADRAARRALEEPAPPPEAPLIEEVDLSCAGNDTVCEGSLAGIVFVDEEGDAANAFLVEEPASGALVQVSETQLRRLEPEAPVSGEAEDKAKPETSAEQPPADMAEQSHEATPEQNEQPEEASNTPMQQVEKTDANEIRKKIAEDRARRRAAAAASRAASESLQSVIDEVGDGQSDVPKSTAVEPEEAAVEADTVQHTKHSDDGDATPSSAEALRQKLLRDRASRKAADRARRKEADSDKRPEAEDESQAVAAAIPCKGRQTIIERSTEQAVRLFCDSSCPLSQRVWICLEEKGVSYEYVPVAQDLSSSEESRRLYPEIVAASPLGRVPALEFSREPGHMDRVHDSMACMEYVDETFDGPPLLPVGNPALRAHVRAWCSFANMHVVPLCLRCIRTLTASKHHEEEVQKQLLERLEAFGQAMAPLQAEGANTSNGAYFLGEAFSMVDITFYPWWLRLNAAEFVAPTEGAFHRLRAWGDACAKRPSVANTVIIG